MLDHLISFPKSKPTLLTAWATVWILMLMPLLGWTQKHTVSGYVTDAASGEKLIGARVFDPVRKVGAISNSYGFYSVTLEGDSVDLVCQYIGYQPAATKLGLVKDSTVHFGLTLEGIEVETVEITDAVDISSQSQMSSIDVPIETIKSLPALMGEVDLIRAIQLLPGVKSGNEGSTGMYVRGGGPDQNLILLDGVPVYNVSHLFGFFSVFPADAISNVNLVKGGFPARYGGRLSSVLDISLKEGNMQEFHGEAGIGVVSSKLTLEGPIQKGKTSFMVSARRTYIDVLAQPLIMATTDGTTRGGYYFYDFVGKVNHRFSDRDRLFLSFYGGRDKVYFKEKREEIVQGTDYSSTTGFDLGWGNKISSLRWNHLFNNKLFGNLTATYSDFNFGIGVEQDDRSTEPNGTTSINRFALGYDSGIRDLGLRLDLDWFANPNHLVRFGGYGTHHTFTPGVSNMEIIFPGFEIDTTFGAQIVRATELGVYVEDDFKIGSRHKLNAGLHASAFLVEGKSYGSIQPRISHRMFLDEKWALKSSFASMAQYVHLLTNVNVGLPTDLWVPATANIRPQQAWQGAIGVSRSFQDLGLEFSAEGYYKYMTGLVEYKEGAAFLSDNSDWQTLVTQGNGQAYGMELLLQRKKGKTNGWIGYTLAWTNRQFEDLNMGRVFPFKYDRRHDLSVVLTHTFSKKVDAGLTWVYGTGNAVTLPIASYLGMHPLINSPLGFSQQIDQVTDRNGFRMRAYHRLDLGVNLHKEFAKWSRTWSFSIYNAYSRQNPFFLYWDTEFGTGKPILKQVSLFPIIPSVSFHAKF